MTMALPATPAGSARTLVHMGRSRDARRAIEVLETVYSDVDSADGWCARVSEQLGPLMTDGSGVVVCLMRRGVHMEVLAHGTSGDVAPWTIDQHRHFLATYPASHLAIFHDPPGPIVRSYSDVAAMTSTEYRAYHEGVNEGHDAIDMLGIFLQPTRGTMVTVGARRYRSRRPAPAVERRLTQLGLHVENAARLHVDPRDAAAIVGPDGRVSHLHRPRDRARIVHAVRELEHIRVRSLRAPSDEHLDLWKGLVGGAYSIIERIERDGRRSYLVFENLPVRHRLRALSAQEASVLELSARGLAGKWIAYSLGLSMATVSDALASAATKMGVGSRVRAVSVAASLLGHRLDAPPVEALTIAERDIVELIASGMSNADIAALRGRSVRTVANQVASILRKTKSGSRRALAARIASGATASGS